jgi:transposase
MRRLEISDADVMQVAIQQEIVRSEESRYDHRLHGVLLVCSGLSTYEVAELFGQSARTVQYWVRRFEQRGFAGLQEAERPGRPAALDASALRQVGKDLRRDPRELGYTQSQWDGKLLSHHLDAAYDVGLGVRQCQRLFRQLDFRRRKPRPLIAKADPEAQRAYKKTPAYRAKKRRGSVV